MKEKIFVIIIIIALLLIIGEGIFYYFRFIKNSDNENNETTYEVIEKTSGDFTLNVQYEGNETWGYIVVGSTPTSCYSVIVETLIEEGDPDTANITTYVTETSTEDTACTQAIEEFEQTGSFTASEDTEITFTVDDGSTDTDAETKTEE